MSRDEARPLHLDAAGLGSRQDNQETPMLATFALLAIFAAADQSPAQLSSTQPPVAVPERGTATRPAPGTREHAAMQPGQQICETHRSTTSRLRRERTCLTRSEWNRQNDNFRQDLERVVGVGTSGIVGRPAAGAAGATSSRPGRDR